MKFKVFGFLSFLLCFVFLLPLGLSSGEVFADENFVQVIASETSLYEDSSFDHPFTLEDGSILKIKHGQKLAVLEDESQGFIKVAYQEEEGYVYARHVTFNVLSQETYPVFNASVEAEETEVLDLDGNPTGIILKKGKELYLYEGYHKEKDPTPVCFVGEDGKLVYGLVKTSDLSPYGINAGVITGIVVTASCVTIILLLLFMKKVKKKKKAE